jgi:ATP-binding cassette subfamily C protein
VPPLVNTFATMTVLVLGGLKVMHGDMTVGMLVAYQSLLAGFIGPLNSFISFGSAIQELEADMNRLDDVLNYPKDKLHADDLAGARPGAGAKAGVKAAGRGAGKGAVLDGAVKLQGKVELRNVTFGYSPLEPPLIEDFNLVIEPGQRVALVGPSGSGKSTVSRLVAGLYAPWKGEILFDGVPRAELPRSLIVNSVGMVDQEVFLFGGTVADNVTMWDSTIPVVHVAAACRDASVEGVIETRPGTYQSTVDEGGTNFSGGERQRLEIGRALVGAPTVMILDEATSALDPTTEVAVDRSLRRRGCTCIIVAHRLSTIRDADEIIVLDHGKVVQRGTHDDLKETEGLYRQLISA